MVTSSDDVIVLIVCPECGHEQPDMGRNVCCEDCGATMPSLDQRKPDSRAA